MNKCQLTPTMLVIERLMIKAANGLPKPGVDINFLTDSINGGSSSPFLIFSISELTSDRLKRAYMSGILMRRLILVCY